MPVSVNVFHLRSLFLNHHLPNMSLEEVNRNALVFAFAAMHLHS